MKTAVSIPDQIYDRAEKLARRLGTSRSELYAKAVQNYVEKHQDDNITAKLNAIYGSEPSGPDPTLMALQTKSWLTHPW